MVTENQSNIQPSNEAETGSKRCLGCNEVKAISEYHDTKARKVTRCKECVSAYQKAYTKINTEKRRATAKAWRESNPDRYKERQRDYRDKNADRIKAQQAEYTKFSRKKLPWNERVLLQANWDLQRDRRLRSTYGISLVEYQAKLADQGGVCAICRQPETLSSRFGRVHALSVDHCHRTGTIRGLLCAKCNKTLGSMRDDTGAMRAAAAYIVQHRQAEPVATNFIG